MSAIPFLHNLNMNKNEVQNLRLENLASAPASPVSGQIYFNTTDGVPYQWNGTEWVEWGYGLIDNTQHGDLGGGSLHAVATDTVNGFMPSGDKDKLDGAASLATASALVMRDADSRFRAASPSHDDDVATKSYVDSSVMGKHAEDIGDGVATSFTINHALGTRDVLVSVRENATPYSLVDADVEATDANNVEVAFVAAPATDEYRVTVIG